MQQHSIAYTSLRPEHLCPLRRVPRGLRQFSLLMTPVFIFSSIVLHIVGCPLLHDIGYIEYSVKNVPAINGSLP